MLEAGEFALNRLIKRLRSHSALTDLEAANLVSVAANLKIERVAGDLVVPGQIVDHICVVADGIVARYGETSKDKRGLVALHIPGDAANLPALMGSGKAIWGLRAVRKTAIIRLPVDPMRSLCKAHPAIALAFWNDTIRDANIAAQWMLSIGRRSAIERIAHLFAELSERHAAVDERLRYEFPFPVTQDQLADVVGLTPIHVNRILKELRDSNVLNKQNNHVIIQDPKQLWTIARFRNLYFM